MYRVTNPLISIILSLLLIRLGFNKDIGNFDKLLDSALTFTSIVIGFLAALLGILVTIKDVEIVTSILEHDQRKGALKHFFKETISIGFFVVILSSTLHVLYERDGIAVSIIFTIWLISMLWFVPAAYRIISHMMGIVFKTNETEKRAKSRKMSEHEAQSLKNRLSKRH